jgi:hypothetical protein
MSVTPSDCLKKYGQPSAKNAWLTLWDVPENLETGLIPNRIYCNRDLILPASKAFQNIIERDCLHEIVTYDGCFNIRKMRGLDNWSLHSWGIALDFNAFANPLGWTEARIRAKGLTPFSQKFLQCWRDAGFECGADWTKRPDGMHFQLAKI